MLVDSHCHLNFPDFREDLDDVVKRARDNGVGVMQTICTEMAEFDEVYGITERYKDIYCSVGVHPNDSGATDVVSAEELLTKTALPNVIGIGETGLDYHYERSDKDTQKKSFREHIKASRESGLPVIIHSRDADEDTVEILKQEMSEGYFKGLIHCFTSSKYLADESIKLGLYISLSGIISFKNATSIREAVMDVPMDRLLVETDAPYLAPIPHRAEAGDEDALCELSAKRRAVLNSRPNGKV